MKSLIVLASVILLAGCDMPKRPNKNIPLTKAEIALLETANSIEISLKALAASQQNKPGNAINIDPLLTFEGGMGNPTTIDYSGPIGPLVEKIAAMSHYKFKAIGPVPPVPVIVSITANNKPVAEILKDVGLQLGYKGDIVVYPQSRVIELRYTRI